MAGKYESTYANVTADFCEQAGIPLTQAFIQKLQKELKEQQAENAPTTPSLEMPKNYQAPPSEPGQIPAMNQPQSK
jgi:hypothetical protein